VACDVLYDVRYLTPWTPQNIQNFQINGTYVYNVDTQQTISDFISAAGQFAGSIAPQAKPAVASIKCRVELAAGREISCAL
jgi:hypothetical protein